MQGDNSIPRFFLESIRESIRFCGVCMVEAADGRPEPAMRAAYPTLPYAHRLGPLPGRLENTSGLALINSNTLVATERFSVLKILLEDR